MEEAATSRWAERNQRHQQHQPPPMEILLHQQQGKKKQAQVGRSVGRSLFCLGGRETCEITGSVASPPSLLPPCQTLFKTTSPGWRRRKREERGEAAFLPKGERFSFLSSSLRSAAKLTGGGEGKFRHILMGHDSRAAAATQSVFTLRLILLLFFPQGLFMFQEECCIFFPAVASTGAKERNSAI